MVCPKRAHNKKAKIQLKVLRGHRPNTKAKQKGNFTFQLNGLSTHQLNSDIGYSNRPFEFQVEDLILDVS